jgi:hypothetical protein
VRPPDPERVQDRQGVPGHVGDRVRPRGVIHRGGAPGVAVVVPDDPAAPVHQAPDDAVVPLGALPLRAHHQQYGRVGRVAEFLGPQLQFTDVDGVFPSVERPGPQLASVHDKETYPTVPPPAAGHRPEPDSQRPYGG